MLQPTLHYVILQLYASKKYAKHTLHNRVFYLSILESASRSLRLQ